MMKTHFFKQFVKKAKILLGGILSSILVVSCNIPGLTKEGSIEPTEVSSTSLPLEVKDRLKQCEKQLAEGNLLTNEDEERGDTAHDCYVDVYQMAKKFPEAGDRIKNEAIKGSQKIEDEYEKLIEETFDSFDREKISAAEAKSTIELYCNRLKMVNPDASILEEIKPRLIELASSRGARGGQKKTLSKKGTSEKPRKSSKESSKGGVEKGIKERVSHKERISRSPRKETMSTSKESHRNKDKDGTKNPVNTSNKVKEKEKSKPKESNVKKSQPNNSGKQGNSEKTKESKTTSSVQKPVEKRPSATECYNLRIKGLGDQKGLTSEERATMRKCN